MRYLLAAVNAKFIHSNPAVYLLKGCAPASCREQIAIAEYTINEYPDRILADIYRRRPDVLAFSCYIWNRKLIFWLVREIKKVLPSLTLWLGGPEASFQAEDILAEEPSVDGIFTGEGEIPFHEFVLEMESARSQGHRPDLAHVPGIVTRKEDGGFLVTADADFPDLDRLPFFYDDLTPFRSRIIYYESSRGCPFHCSYCLSSREDHIRLRSLPLVREDLLFFLDRKLPQVKFLDRTFNFNEEHALGIWNFLKEHDNDITNFHFELESDLLTEKELVLLESLRPGLVQAEIGVQSTNSRTLAALHRRTDFSWLEKCCRRLLKNRNIHVHLDLIAGLPYEDLESFAHSFNQVYRLHPHELQLGFLKLLPGTELRERADQFGITALADAPYEVLSTRWLSYDDILLLKNIEEVLEIYYNSGQFSLTMAALENYFPDPFSMYRQLALFYEGNHYFVQTPSRIRRYDILLEFIIETVRPEAEVVCRFFAQLLTCDLYLRENMKSRPSFAEAQTYRRHPKNVHLEEADFPLQQILPYYPGKAPAMLPEKKTLLSFDYENRSPVTGNVTMTEADPGNGNVQQ